MMMAKRRKAGQARQLPQISPAGHYKQEGDNQSVVPLLTSYSFDGPMALTAADGISGQCTYSKARYPLGHSVTERDSLASSSRSQSSACGQVSRIASRPASAMTRGPSIVFAYCG